MEYIKRAFADIISSLGSVLIGFLAVFIVLTLFFVRDAIPFASSIIWVIVFFVVVILLVLLGFCILFVGLYYSSRLVLSIRVKWLEFERTQRKIEKEIDVLDTDETSNVVDSKPNNLMLNSGNTDTNNSNNLSNLPRIIYYKDIRNSVKAGQIFMGVKSDNTIRVGTLDDYKILLVLGMSSSGKTTTMVEKCVNGVRGGAELIPCDPHASKPDSLFNRIYPLQFALFPSAKFAFQHDDILRNLRIARAELERRVSGGFWNRKLLIVIEEWNRLIKDKSMSKELITIVEKLGQEGRGYGVNAIIGAQKITGSVELRKSVISAIVHKVDITEAQLVIPARFSKYALELKPGLTFVRDADGLTEMLQQAYITLQDVQLESNEIKKYIAPSAYSSLLVDNQNTMQLNNNLSFHETPTDEIPVIRTEETPMVMLTLEQKLNAFVDNAKNKKGWF